VIPQLTVLVPNAVIPPRLTVRVPALIVAVVPMFTAFWKTALPLLIFKLVPIVLTPCTVRFPAVIEVPVVRKPWMMTDRLPTLRLVFITVEFTIVTLPLDRLRASPVVPTS
jgi:hypothetical protein